ncbi:Zn-dependent protease with chaperone function [Archangium gephyra]|uniref:Zn-dependent protease n=1 Tax=Archangium gephyra TaxID=48 RepID=A0AAC8TGW2_9BACT|nr:M48 family metallopeptidase [Archangium gephyra]AKJ05652.1 Zn-dependent protease [Archangium gephyra]REG36333.1 Zn-dependent protease with chaperone function [Archangium gephyra]
MRPALTLPGFLRVYALPALWLFALPLFGLWFASHATSRFDQTVLTTIESQISQDASLDEARRQELLEFFRTVPASAACLSTAEELAGFRDSLGEACSDVEQFDGIRLLALGSALLGLASGMIALLCALAAFISRPFQYGSFVVGWNVLRVTGALQALAQGALAVWLSYWVTAVWFERYYPKLIGIIGLLAAFALFQVVAAIFRRPATDFEVEAEVIEPTHAPELWAHVRQLCEQLKTQPPDHILAGIDTNFFVTESEVHVGQRTLTGRTLYVSLSLLRMLEKSEADAVLAHEMGHLLGGDTGHSKRLAPMLARFGNYLQALREGGLTLPIFHFMVAYRGLFELSLGRSRRASELAADRLAAGVTSGRDIARSLIKVGAYASFRDRVEADLFARGEQQQTVAIAERVALGFAQYAGSEAVHGDLNGSVTPHPFDSHPPLAARLENVGETLTPDDVVKVLLAPTSASWVSAILEAEAIEARLWGAYEARFAQAHDLVLAYRYVPSTEAERQHVEKHFPPLTFQGKEDTLEVRLDYAQVSCTEWEEPVRLEQVKSATTEERLFKKYLDLQLEGGGLFKGKRSICLSKLQNGDGMLQAFGHYLGRHRTMEEHRKNAQQAA